nr:hypothetical protein [Cressdnaviricota sp.]UOF82863.1 hypothetical protein [Cressdnaviricota sp.]
MENYIAIRLTDNNQFTQDDLKKFANKHTNIILIKEYKVYHDDKPNEGPHYHGYYFGDLSLKTVVYYLHKELHCRGNKDYSVSQKKIKEHSKISGIDGYKRYCCKGEDRTNPPIEFYNILLDDVLKYHSEYYQKQEEFKDAHLKGGKKLGDLQYYVQENLHRYDNNMSSIIDLILEYHKLKSLMVSDFQVENYYNYIRTIIDSEYIIQRSARIYHKINRI